MTPQLKEIFALLEKKNLIELLESTNDFMSSFFVVCSALKRFYKEYNTLPVAGSIPDMTASNQFYIELKKVYDKKALEDKEIIAKYSAEILNGIKEEHLQIKKEKILASFSGNRLNMVDIICKNCQQITLFSYSTIGEEKITPKYDEGDLTTYDENADGMVMYENFKWYLMMKASDHFFIKHQRYPGQYKDHDKFSEDVPELQTCLAEVIKKQSSEPFFNINDIDEKYFYETCRFSNFQVAPIVSIVGSITTQEVIKLITYSFLTVSNTVIFNGIVSNTNRFEF